MNIFEPCRIAVGNLRTNKLRTFLTLLGIIVGVAAVIAVMTIIDGLNRKVAQTFNTQGANVFTLRKLPLVILSRDDFLRYMKRKNIEIEDAEALVSRCAGCDQIGYDVASTRTVKLGSERSDNVAVRGATENVFQISSINIDSGRTYSEYEAAHSRPVCVVGADIVTNLFPATDPLGKTITVDGNPFEIIGVTERYGSIFGFSRDNFVMIPFNTYQKIYGGHQSLSVYISAKNPDQIEEVEQEVRNIMRTRRQKTFRDADEGFSVETTEVFLDLYGSATANIYLVSFIVSGISLVVGGIVIMNIMLVSVTERTKEIGIRKAVGARRLDILSQFLIESITISALGGILGILTGYSLAYLIAAYTDFPLFIQIWSVVLGVGVSSIVGIVFGVYPANRAARLDPIEALRSE
jgi:putative ABC transport system permease protein